MLKRFSVSILVLTLLLVSGGCRLSRSQHTLVLSPDGWLTWTVIEQEIRSDDADLPARGEEEARYLDEIAAGEHPVALALEALGAHFVDTRLLRSSRPYVVWSSADLGPVDGALEQFLARTGLPGAVRLEKWSGGGRLVITIGPQSELESDGESGSEDTVLMALVDDLERYRLVLSEGHFVDAVGFRIEESDHAVAVPLERSDEEIGPDDTLVFALTWSSEPLSRSEDSPPSAR
ncbi:MAG: hypothetical protein JSV80_13435 [Acidobacteriota bacterium]|nr:MAG: hypothetical protein JSV80_13435 [Acidobacteriota bacterium]